MPARLLLVDDRSDQLERLRGALVDAGVPADRLVCASSGREALAKFDGDVAVALCDLSFDTADPGTFLGEDPAREGIAIALALQREAEARGLSRPVVFIHTAFPGEVRAGALGGIHVATLVGLDTPLGRVAAAFREREREQTHRLALVERAWMKRFGGAWTPSLLARVDTLAIAVVDVHLPVLISGPTGTGKEGIGRLIHEAGAALGTRSAELVAFSCAGLQESLAESELFGHEKGAFTGADRRRNGLWVLAEGGTLVLDEVHALPLPLQSRLLRALSPGVIRPVGGVERPVRDVRVVALTKADLHEEVDAGRFLPDLYYRLRGIVIDLPPLSGQPDDVRALVHHMLAHARGEGPSELSAEAEEELAARPWPGNARELENAVLVARARARARHAGRIERADLPAHDRRGDAAAGRYAAAMGEHDARLRLLAVEAWQAAGYSLKAAVDATGIPKTTLWRRLREQAELWRRSETRDAGAIARQHGLTAETVGRLLELGR